MTTTNTMDAPLQRERVQQKPFDSLIDAELSALGTAHRLYDVLDNPLQIGVEAPELMLTPRASLLQKIEETIQAVHVLSRTNSDSKDMEVGEMLQDTPTSPWLELKSLHKEEIAHAERKETFSVWRNAGKILANAGGHVSVRGNTWLISLFNGEERKITIQEIELTVRSRTSPPDAFWDFRTFVMVESPDGKLRIEIKDGPETVEARRTGRAQFAHLGGTWWKERALICKPDSGTQLRERLRLWQHQVWSEAADWTQVMRLSRGYTIHLDTTMQDLLCVVEYAWQTIFILRNRLSISGEHVCLRA